MVTALIIAIAVLIVLSGLFSCSDMVYASVNQLRLKKDARKSKASRLALKHAENYNTTITTILFSNNLVNIAATSLLAVLVRILFPNEDLAATLAPIALVIIILVFGEILPKVIGRAYSYRLAKLFAYPVKILQYIFFPFIFITSNIGKFFASFFIRKKKENIVSDEELEEMVESIEEEGVIDEDQSELLKSAIAFKETEAYEIMTPRVDIFAINIDEDQRKILSSDEIFKHSRIPIYKGSIDNIIGMLPTKAVLRNMLASKPVNFSSLMYDVQFVPRSMGISEILKLMKKNKNHVVIVKDEFGGTDGMLTMEDILEELVGEMWDETDKIQESYRKIKRNQYLVDGSMNIEDFFDLVNVPSPLEVDYTTVGGWVLDELHRFAKVGDHFKYKNLTVEVKDVTEFTVEKIIVRIGRKKVNEDI